MLLRWPLFATAMVCHFALIAPGLSAELRFMGFDTQASLDANLDLLNNVSEGTSPRYEVVGSGTEPTYDIDVLLGANAGEINWFTASKPGYFGARDRRSLSEAETFFGLQSDDRHIAECSGAFDGLECVAYYYACPSNPPECQLSLLSFGQPGSKGITKVTWTSVPSDHQSP